MENRCGKNNPLWKGDYVGNGALHAWVRRNKPKNELCEKCGKEPSYDVANISGEYKRDVNDYQWLCRCCHMKGDGRIEKLLKHNRTSEQRKKTSERTSGKNNPRWNKPVSKETRKKLSIANSGENNPFYKKNHTDDTRRRMSENHSDVSGEKNPMWHRKHTKESRRKMRESKRLISIARKNNWDEKRVIVH